MKRLLTAAVLIAASFTASADNSSTWKYENIVDEMEGTSIHRASTTINIAPNSKLPNYVTPQTLMVVCPAPGFYRFEWEFDGIMYGGPLQMAFKVDKKPIVRFNANPDSVYTGHSIQNSDAGVDFLGVMTDMLMSPTGHMMIRVSSKSPKKSTTLKYSLAGFAKSFNQLVAGCKVK